MFAQSPKSTAATRREKQTRRRAQAVSRSGSILGTIKNTVAASLSWLVSKEEPFEDLGKRRRSNNAPRDYSDDDAEETRQAVKRMRVDSPSLSVQQNQNPSSGYLDPPSSTIRRNKPSIERARDEEMGFKRHSMTYGTLPSSLSRTMEPPSNYATQRRDPAQLHRFPSLAASTRSFTSGTRESPDKPSALPFKLRTSLTPKPSNMPLRREASAPPPIASLRSKPIFVKPPPEEIVNQKRAERTLSLGTLAEYSRSTRSPSRDRVLTSLGSLSSIPSLSSLSSSNVSLQPSISRSEKLLHDLEYYKTPIIPSRYKDSNSLPDFLKPKRVHVPVPMSKKGKERKPSLGMASKGRDKKKESRGRDTGKPYARTGGTGKLLARRKAEEEEIEFNLSVVKEEEEMETDIKPKAVKRDVGVSAVMSGSDDERSSAEKSLVKDIDLNASPSYEDPFSKNHRAVRNQPYGRIGRVRVRDPGQRSVPLSKGRNKFSAVFDDDDMAADVDVDIEQNRSFDDKVEQEKKQETQSNSFGPPPGFTFANNSTIIEHDHSRAKEPPISFLPFSLLKAESVKSVESNFTAPPSERTPFVLAPSESTSQTQMQHEKNEITSTSPQVISSVSPKLPITESSKQASMVSDFFATAPAGNSDVTKQETSSGIPNFFAKSAFLSAEKPAPVSTPTNITSSVGVINVTTPESSIPNSSTSVNTEIKNQSWQAVSFPTFAPMDTSVPKPLSESAAPEGKITPSSPSNTKKTSTSEPVASPFFVSQVKSSEAPTTEVKAPSTSFFGSAPAGNTSTVQTTVVSGVTSSPFGTLSQSVTTKATESDKPATTFFNFGSGNGSVTSAPKPLFGTGSITSNPFSATTSQPSATEQKPPSFTFGAPPVAGSSSSSSAIGGESVAVPRPLFGGTPSNSGFAFGMPSSTSNNESQKSPSPFVFGGSIPAAAPTSAQQTPSFTFGTPATSATSSGSIGFTFGTPTKSVEPPSSQSPFTFGTSTPARPVTPPSKLDEGMSMEESPVRDVVPENKPMGGISFGLGPTPVNPFSQNSSNPAFSFNASNGVSNPFATKEASTSSNFNFNRTASAPALSTSFSFGAKSDVSTPPATAFGSAPNPFGGPSNSMNTAPSFGAPPPSSSSSSSPFTFGQSQPAASSFGAPTQSTSSATPSSPFTSAPSFTFGASSGTSNLFAFGASAPSSPATGVTGLPQSPATVGSSFTFGQPSSSSGGSLFNIGAAPSSATGGTPGRQVRKLPRRGPPPKR